MKEKIRRGGRGRFRGRMKDCSTKTSWVIYHNNVRGYESKKDSLTAIFNQVKPNIVTMNETHMNEIKNLNFMDIFLTHAIALIRAWGALPHVFPIKS